MNVEFYNPELPVGMNVEVGGILLVNGENVTVDEDALILFESRNGRSYREALQNVQFVKIDGASSYVPPAPSVEETTGDDEDEVGDN